MSLNHLLTRKPFNIHCDACNLGKMRKAKKFVGSYHASRQPTSWLDLVTADHLVAKNGGIKGTTVDFNALVVKDLYSKVKVLFPVRDKTGEEATRALMYFFGNHAVLDLFKKRLELAFPKIIPSSSVLTSTSSRVLVLRSLICAALPGCFWPFASQHSASSKTPVASALTENL